MTNQIKPCPFCGDKNPSVNDIGNIRCSNLQCVSAQWYLPEIWNHRPREDAMMRVVDLAREMVEEMASPGGAFMVIERDLLGKLECALADLDAIGAGEGE